MEIFGIIVVVLLMAVNVKATALKVEHVFFPAEVRSAHHPIPMDSGFGSRFYYI